MKKFFVKNYADVYQEEANKTATILTDTNETNKYAVMKLSEEIGELTGMLAKHYYHGKEFDRENLIEEMGDILWYLALLAKNNDLPLSEIMEYNIEKLRARHGESYNKEYYEE